MPIVIDPPESTLAGILGVEARHQWNDAIVLGDESASPRVKIEGISGLRSLADPEDRRDLATGRRGEIERDSLRRGKTLVYELMLQARSLAELRQLASRLGGAFDDLRSGRMLVTPHPDYTAGFSRFFYARALTLEEGKEVPNPDARWQFQQPFALALRMADARFYDPQQVVGETGDIAETGGLAPPFTPPLILPSVGDGAGAVVVTNPGTAASDPVIDIYGPVTNPEVSNLTQGLAIAFDDVTIAAGDFLRIDFAARTVLLEGTSDYRAKIDWDESDWWDPGADGLLPGENVIQLRGDSVADPATARVSFYPAYTA